jgi:hypothetical protein
MTTPSAAITVNGTAVPTTGAVAVLRNTTVTLALVSTSGVSTLEVLAQQSSESGLALPTITYVGTPATGATFPMPDRHNQGYSFKVTVNKGKEDETVSYALIGVVGETGRIPFVAGEYQHRGTLGWASELNAVAAYAYSLRFTSTNDTDTTRLTIPMSTDDQTVFEVCAHARDLTTNTDRFAKHWRVYAYRNDTGVVVVGSESTPFPNVAIDAAWTCTAIGGAASDLYIKFKGDPTNSVLAYVSANPIYTTR